MRRAVIPVAGLALIGVIVFVGVRDMKSEQAPAKVRLKTPRPPVGADAASSSESNWVSPPDPVPLDPASEAQTARAMDEVGLRYQVSRLRMAALAGDPNVTKSVQVAVRRYGRDASALLSSEIERESDPVVREALIGARNGLK